MPRSIRRRSFFRGLSLATAGAAALCRPSSLSAREPIERKGKSKMLLGLAAYSFRNYFKDATHERENPPKSGEAITLFDFVDFCAAQGCHGAELTAYYFPANVGNEFLLDLKRHAFLNGVEISGSAVGNTFTHPEGPERRRQMEYVKTWIDHCQVIGAPHLRVFAGSRQRTSQEEAKKLCIAALEEACDYAGNKGVMLGIENHGGIVAEADDLLDLIRSVDSPWLGINFDSGNFHTEDPYGDLAKIAPYTINAQLKVEMRPANGRNQEADLPRLISILKEVNYRGYVTLEYEAAEDPWKAIPRWLERLKELIA